MSQTNPLFEELVNVVRSIYGSGDIPLHRPVFSGREKEYLSNCIDSNFVSSVGAQVVEFERGVAGFTGSPYAIATVNGTSGLHIALLLAGVRPGSEVITQALSFIATCNAISYSGAKPVFVDVDQDTFGMSPEALQRYLQQNCQLVSGRAVNRSTGREISACVPMHTFGFPCRIAEISEICAQFGIPLVEDAAESLGSFVGTQHTGTFADLSVLSFNGNKVITTGGGGMILAKDEALARRAKHLTTTAKIPHPFEFVHDEVGYNYRLPNLNAALGCAQLENLRPMLEEKARVAHLYEEWCTRTGVTLLRARSGTTPNYWLNAIVLESLESRDRFLEFTNSRGIMTRPVWRLMNRLEMYKDCQTDGLSISKWLEDRVVNLPSSVPALS